mgnify:CR=1 FL=1
MTAKTTSNKENNNKKGGSLLSNQPSQITKKNFSTVLAPLTEDWHRDLFTAWLSDSDPTVSIGAICDRHGFDKVAVSVALKVDKGFSTVYGKVRKIIDKVELMMLESVSEKNAKEPKNMVERLFRLKSLDRDRYADKNNITAGANININVAMGDGVKGYTDITAPINNKPTKQPQKNNKLNAVVSTV